MATTPATTECHLMQPIAKSTTAQIEKKTSGVGRFIYTSIMLQLLSVPAAQKIVNRHREDSGDHRVYTHQTDETEHSSVPSLGIIWPRRENPFCAVKQALENGQEVLGPSL